MPPASAVRTAGELISAADGLIQKGDFKGAIDLLVPFAAPQQDTSALVLMKLAEALMRAEKPGDAIPFLDRAYRKDPANAECAFLFGRALLDASLFDRSLPLLNQALKADPDSYKVHWALADYHIFCDRADLAIPHYESAIANIENPVQKAALTLYLGVAHKIINQGDLALKCFDSVVEPETIRLSAVIQSFSLKKQAPDGPAALRLTEIVKTTRNPYHRNDALLALAKCHAAENNFDKAFSLCKEARSQFPIVNHKASALAQSATAKRRIFTKKLYDDTAALTSTDEHIILIAGMPRSGTTLLEQVLGAHSEAAGFGESTRFLRLAGAFQHHVSALPDPHAAILASAGRGELRQRAETNLQFLRSISDKPWSRAVEKTPMNYEAMGHVHLIHPRARFIVCRRHPADSFISSYENPLSAFHDYAYDQVTYAERFLDKEELVKYWKQVFPRQIIEVDYEKLVQSPEAEVRRILDFAGLPWEDGTMKFFERTTTVRTFSTQQVRSSFYSTSVGRWKNYEKHLKPLFDKLQSAGFVYETAG